MLVSHLPYVSVIEASAEDLHRFRNHVILWLAMLLTLTTVVVPLLVILLGWLADGPMTAGAFGLLLTSLDDAPFFFILFALSMITHLVVVYSQSLVVVRMHRQLASLKAWSLCPTRRSMCFWVLLALLDLILVMLKAKSMADDHKLLLCIRQDSLDHVDLPSDCQPVDDDLFNFWAFRSLDWGVHMCRWLAFVWCFVCAPLLQRGPWTDARTMYLLSGHLARDVQRLCRARVRIDVESLASAGEHDSVAVRSRSGQSRSSHVILPHFSTAGDKECPMKEDQQHSHHSIHQHNESKEEEDDDRYRCAYLHMFLHHLAQ